MGDGKSGGAGAKARTGGAAERLSKSQKDEEKRQVGISKDRDNKNRADAETFSRTAAQTAVAAAEKAGSQWNGFNNTQVEALTKAVYGVAKQKQKQTGTASLTQADANKLVGAAVKKEMGRYTKAENAMENKMRDSYSKAGFAKPTSNRQRSEIERVIALAADNAMGRIYSSQGASAKLKSGATTSSFLKKGLQQAAEALNVDI